LKPVNPNPDREVRDRGAERKQGMRSVKRRGTARRRPQRGKTRT
jgi:hypothetical protein